MKLTPIEFINLLSTGKTEKECNRKECFRNENLKCILFGY